MAVGDTISAGWGDPAKERDEHSGLWLHVPARGRLTVCVLSAQPVRFVGHWVAGHMRMCPGPGCIWHERRLGQQVRYGFSVLDTETRACGLLEVGASAAEVIYRTSNMEGRLRGLCFVLRKEGQRDRGRVLVTAIAPIVSLELLPPADDVAGHLERQYGAGESTSSSTLDLPAGAREYDPAGAREGWTA